MDLLEIRREDVGWILIWLGRGNNDGGLVTTVVNLRVP
jgi:hypothetical protein